MFRRGRRPPLKPALLLFIALTTAALLSTYARAQQRSAAEAPVIVQPGAPGQPTRTLPPDTHAKLAPLSHADVEFMQGMIVHHQQAVVMTEMIPSHTANPQVRLLGERINHSQADEIAFMKRWLAARGQPTSATMAGMSGMAGMDHSDDVPLMPGMLTRAQMTVLRNARGAEFDRLFLTGMIQHHGGALTMVKDLFSAAGAGQESEIFNFATDVDTGQRAEIRIMQSLLDKEFKEKR